MTATLDDRHDEIVEAALADLRETRRRRRMADWHIIDALYKAYLAAVVGSVGVTMVSGLVGDQRLHGAALRDVHATGPAAIGLVLAVAVAFGLRSGGRGGPLALEAAEVRYVLFAPVDRDVALRQPALRQMRFAAFTGVVCGATVGLLAYRRFPGSPGAWIACGALVGLAGSVSMTGAAMIASGRRMSPRLASLVGAVVVAWSVGDALVATKTSPFSFIGAIGLWPLDFTPLSAVALAIPVALAVAGLRAVGAISLEAAERRGKLVTHLRFAATMQDVRTVMLLRRQLAAELPRSKPWIRLRPASRMMKSAWVTWRRDWRGILRWPGVRVVRLTVLGIVAGLSVAGAWAGTTPLVVVAGLALFVAGLDAIEGLAQEVDHPHREASFPEPSGALHLRHLAAPVVVLVAVGLAGVAAAAAAAALLGGDPALAVQVGLPLVLPCAAGAVGAAAVSTLRSPPDPSRLMMDSTGMSLVIHHAFPPAIATAAPAISLLVKWELERSKGASPMGVALNTTFNIWFLIVLVFGWVRHREAVRGFFGGDGVAAAGKK